jgi:hypothetical protein
MKGCRRVAAPGVQELHKLAAHRMANEAPGHTLQPTALVHEGVAEAGEVGSTIMAKSRPLFGA